MQTLKPTPNLLPASTQPKLKTIWNRLNGVQKRIPTAIALCGTGVAVHYAHDPILDSFFIAVLLSVLYLFVVGQLLKHVALAFSSGKWLIALGTATVSLLAAPQLMFAQGTTSTAGTCANAGFLNKLAVFANGVLTGLPNGNVTLLQSFICQIIGWMALLGIFLMVGSIITAGYMIVSNQSPIASVSTPVVGIMLTILFTVGVVLIMSTPW
jgi:hypothetical protein